MDVQDVIVRNAGAQKRMNQGTTISAAPTITIHSVLEMKYGKTIRTSPHDAGTSAFWFFPYQK